MQCEKITKYINLSAYSFWHYCFLLLFHYISGVRIGLFTLLSFIYQAAATFQNNIHFRQNTIPFKLA